jgi:hypothetical protein
MKESKHVDGQITNDLYPGPGICKTDLQQANTQ